jgi:hypothetical protein
MRVGVTAFHCEVRSIGYGSLNISVVWMGHRSNAVRWISVVRTDQCCPDGSVLSGLISIVRTDQYYPGGVMMSRWISVVRVDQFCPDGSVMSGRTSFVRQSKCCPGR